MMEWGLTLLLTFAAGNQGHQDYHYQTEAECRAKEAERRVWAETQVKDGGVQKYSVVTCHPQESYVVVTNPRVADSTPYVAETHPAFAAAGPAIVQARNFTGISTPGPILKPSTGAMNFFANGQWMTYTMNFPTSGRYRMMLQVATIQPGTRWSTMVDDVDLGSSPVAITADWNTYTWQNGPVVLIGAGQHTVKLTSVQQYFDPLALQFQLLEPMVGFGTGAAGPPGPPGEPGAAGPPGKDGASVCTASPTEIGVWVCPPLTMPGLHVTGDANVDGNVNSKAGSNVGTYQ